MKEFKILEFFSSVGKESQVETTQLLKKFFLMSVLCKKFWLETLVDVKAKLFYWTPNCGHEDRIEETCKLSKKPWDIFTRHIFFTFRSRFLQTFTLICFAKKCKIFTLAEMQNFGKKWENYYQTFIREMEEELLIIMLSSRSRHFPQVLPN